MNVNSTYRCSIASLLMLGCLVTTKVGKAQEANDLPDPPVSGLLPVFEPGMHVKPINAVGFTADGRRVVTVGKDLTVQIWDVKTGERLEILRLPGYGQEERLLRQIWETAAVSPDGKYVAIGGGNREIGEGSGKENNASLIIVDIQQRKVVGVHKSRGHISALAFTPDGEGLAISYRDEPIRIDVMSSWRTERRRKRKGGSDTVRLDYTLGNVQAMRFSPDGKSLLVGGTRKNASLISLRDEPVITELENEGPATDFAWAPDGKKFVRVWTGFYGAERGFDLCDATGKRIKRVSFSSLPGFSRRTHPGSVTFLDDHQIILFVCDSSGTESAAAIKYDLDNDKHEVLFQQQEFGLFAALGAVAADRKHAVIVTGMGLNAVVIDMATGKSVARCGSLTPLPTWVGWAKPGKGNQFAWSEADERRFRKPQADSLEYGFDLDQMQLLPAISTDDFSVAKTEHEDWGFERDKEGGGRWVTKAGKPVEGESNSHVNISAFTMVPRGDQPPLVAWANRGLLQASGNIHLEEVEGDGLVMLKPKVVCCQALAPSPDGRLLVASTGTHQIVIYATSGRDTPLLSFARVNGEWVIWSPEGYFAASPGGEKLIGWAVNDGPDKLAKFYPAAQFGSYFRRSDLLRQVIEQITSAKVKDAIESRGVNLDKLQLPVVDMRVLKQTAETLEVMVKATSKVNDQPVTSLRLLLNGRPMANGQGVKQFAGNELAEATFSIRLPPGTNELKALGKSVAGAALSEPVKIRGPKSAADQPALFRICIGVNDYEQASLRLKSAAKDARELFTGLETYCVGATNRYGRSDGKLLVDREATRANVLKAISEIQTKVSPGDLVIVSFAGHGVRQGEEYYLLTSEADPSRSLANRSLSGADLQAAFGKLECPVLLILDACHSAQSIKAFRPVVDDLTRNLTSDSVGVTVLAAAMADEVANATAENGYFTKAILKALAAGQDVPYDTYENILYTHHIYSVVFTEVRRATSGRQNPFLNMPWTVQPLALREVTPNTH